MWGMWIRGIRVMVGLTDRCSLRSLLQQHLQGGLIPSVRSLLSSPSVLFLARLCSRRLWSLCPGRPWLPDRTTRSLQGSLQFRSSAN